MPAFTNRFSVSESAEELLGGQADATPVRVVSDAAIAERAVQHQVVIVGLVQ